MVVSRCALQNSVALNMRMATEKRLFSISSWAEILIRKRMRVRRANNTFIHMKLKKNRFV